MGVNISKEELDRREKYVEQRLQEQLEYLRNFAEETAEYEIESQKHSAMKDVLSLYSGGFAYNSSPIELEAAINANLATRLSMLTYIRQRKMDDFFDKLRYQFRVAVIGGSIGLLIYFVGINFFP